MFRKGLLQIFRPRSLRHPWKRFEDLVLGKIDILERLVNSTASAFWPCSIPVSVEGGFAGVRAKARIVSGCVLGHRCCRGRRFLRADTGTLGIWGRTGIVGRLRARCPWLDDYCIVQDALSQLAV
jgi:hypothetical protein